LACNFGRKQPCCRAWLEGPRASAGTRTANASSLAWVLQVRQVSAAPMEPFLWCVSARFGRVCHGFGMFLLESLANQKSGCARGTLPPTDTRHTHTNSRGATHATPHKQATRRHRGHQVPWLHAPGAVRVAGAAADAPTGAASERDRPPATLSALRGASRRHVAPPLAVGMALPAQVQRRTCLGLLLVGRAGTLGCYWGRSGPRSGACSAQTGSRPTAGCCGDTRLFNAPRAPPRPGGSLLLSSTSLCCGCAWWSAWLQPESREECLNMALSERLSSVSPRPVQLARQGFDTNRTCPHALDAAKHSGRLEPWPAEAGVAGCRRYARC